MKTILDVLAANPFVLLFLVVAAGYALGRVTVRGLGLGTTASTLLVGLGISLFAATHGVSVQIPELAGTIFFNLFMFSIGMKVGPQFLVGLRRDARHFIVLALFIPLVSLGLMFVVRALFDLGPGLVPGIFAGANTATPGLGAAQTAFSGGAARLPPGVSPADAVSTMSTAFAFSYCLSIVLFVVLMKVPDLLGRDSRGAARELEAAIRSTSDEPLPGSADEFFGRPLPVTLRSYDVEAPALIGRRLAELRQTYPLLSVEQVCRDGEVLKLTDDLVLARHDHVAVYGQIASLVTAGPRIGPEVYERATADVGSQTVDVVVHRPEVVGRSIGELASNVGHGLYLNAMFRGGEAVPHGPETILRRGDVLRVTGSKWRIGILEKQSGGLVKASVSTDIVTLAVGLSLGALIGLITIPLGAIKLQIGAAVGLLVVGMVLSILRTRNPKLGGPFPEPARQLFEDLGLNVFLAVLGLNSGAGVLKAVAQGVIGPVVICTVIVGFIPAILAWFLAHRAWRMNDALLLGAVAGARCNSAGLRAAQETTQSTVPAISYPATFAISNIVFTLLAYVMAMIG